MKYDGYFERKREVWESSEVLFSASMHLGRSSKGNDTQHQSAVPEALVNPDSLIALPAPRVPLPRCGWLGIARTLSML